MTRWARLAAAFVLSLVACGAAQYTVMVALGEGQGRRYSVEAFIEVFTPLAVAVVAVTAVFALVIRCGPYAGRLALVLLPVMAAAGTALYITGINSRSPGVGGNVFYAVATVVVFYYLSPCALAIPIHWLMLRRA